MTNKEAIRRLKDHFRIHDDGRPTPYLDKAKLMAYEALEKQIPEPPYMWGDGYADGELVYDMWDCPGCDTSYEIEGYEYKYCPNCGQAIKWEV